MTKYVRFCSLGLLWAWVYCSWKTELLFPGMKGTNISSDPSWLANVCLVIFAFIVTPILVKQATARGRRVMVAFSTIAMVIGVFGSAAFAGSQGPMVIGSYISGMLTGFGSGVLFSFCGAQFTSLTIEKLETAVLLNLLFTPLCSLVASALVGTVFGVLFVAALPLTAGILLFLSPDIDPLTPPHEDNLDIFLQPSRREIVAMGIVVLLFHAATAIQLSAHSVDNIPVPFDSLSGFFHTLMVLGSVATLLVCFVVIAHSRRIDFNNICRISIPIYLLGVVFLPMGQLPFVSLISQALIAFSGTYFSLVVYIVFIKLAKTQTIPVYYAVAGFMAPYEIGVLSGNLLTVASMSLPDRTLQLSLQVAIIVGTLAIALLVAPVWNRTSGLLATTQARGTSRQVGICVDQSCTTKACSSADEKANIMTDKPLLNEGRLVSDKSTCGSDQLDEFTSRSSESTLFYNSLQRIADRYGLTAREAEICGYLAQGRSRPYVRELLCVSKSTVDTHVRHAYAKLTIHSNQELIDLLQAEINQGDN